MSPWYRFCRNLAYALGRLLWGLRVAGRENIPRSGPVVVACNHISLLDPAVLGAVIPREAAFAAKRELFALRWLGPLIRSLNAAPLDRARTSRGELSEIGRFLDRGKVLVYFPEGTRSRDGRLGKAKTGIGLLLAQHPALVVPAYVEGTESPLRNLFRRGRMRVVFGRPHALPEEEARGAGGRAQYARLAEWVMDGIRRLKETVSSDDREPGPPGGRASARRKRAGGAPPAGSGIREKGR